MTGTCTLCGTILTVEPDGVFDEQREARMFGRLGAAMKAHMQKYHRTEPQRIIDPSYFAPMMKKPEAATVEQAIGLGATVLMATGMYSFIQCDDPDFNKQIEEMRALIGKVIEQKPMRGPAAGSVVAG